MFLVLMRNALAAVTGPENLGEETPNGIQLQSQMPQ